jgi:hypothetical protein
MPKLGGLWSGDELKITVVKIRKELSVNHASNEFNIPRSPLHAHVMAVEARESYDAIPT